MIPEAQVVISSIVLKERNGKSVTPEDVGRGASVERETVERGRAGSLMAEMRERTKEGGRQSVES